MKIPASWFASLVFGVGWGIAGLCLGPALVALGLAPAPAGVFVAAMLAGMLAFEAFEAFEALEVLGRRRRSSAVAAAG